MSPPQVPVDVLSSGVKPGRNLLKDGLEQLHLEHLALGKQQLRGHMWLLGFLNQPIDLEEISLIVIVIV